VPENSVELARDVDLPSLLVERWTAEAGVLLISEL
jgi:hypothetical protein